MNLSTEAVRDKMAQTCIPQGTVRQTRVSWIEATQLEGVSVKHVIKFKELRQLYEIQIDEKGNQTGTKITETLYRASIEKADWEIFFAAG